jgi:hypothetical protein
LLGNFAEGNAFETKLIVFSTSVYQGFVFGPIKVLNGGTFASDLFITSAVFDHAVNATPFLF